MEAPDLTTFVVLHRAMRADVDRLALLVAVVPEAGRDLAGSNLERWYLGFCAEVAEHHAAEEEIWFPALAAAVPAFEAHRPRLAAEHEALDRALAACGDELRALRDARVPWIQAHAAATEAADALRRRLGAHLDFEDSDVLPLFLRHVDADEQRRLDARTRDHRYQHLARRRLVPADQRQEVAG